MGNESSSVDAGDARRREKDGETADEAVAEFCGFRVLGIQEKSPAARVGFVSFFDFILSANGIRLDTRDSTLMELIAQSEEQPMQLEVYNIKSQTARELELVPSRNWPGKGLLGVTIRFDSYEYAEDQLLHVLDVAKGSPADDAGLNADIDYLLGTPEHVFRDPGDLHDEILDAMDDSFQCYVYNTENDQVRIIRISPSDQWGGAGVLGAEVGHGVLHRLPSACRDTVGTSIGFVSLSEEAKAATDPYLRRAIGSGEAGHEESSSLPEYPPQMSSEGPSATDMAESTEASGNSEVQSSDSDAALPPSTEESATQQSISAASLPQETTPVGPDVSESPDPVQATPEPKPRYAARIDPRFPMSTIAVLADPTQIN